MSLVEKLGLAALHRLDPETAHKLSLLALRMGLAPLPQPVSSTRLQTTVAGLELANPVGLAAGFDKNAVAVGPLLRAGFGFVEVGAATPYAQPGNPQPRLFRLSEDRAVINRFGFNNDGANAIAARLARRPKGGIVGLNLGANKESVDKSADYGRVLVASAAHVDFVTVNVSSPNTEQLRDLQGAAALASLLAGVMQARAQTRPGLPVFLKVAPDLSEGEIADIADVALKAGVSAIIATNTTLARGGLADAHRDEAGGLSGAPLFERSTRVLAQFARTLEGRLPLIGVGGIGDAQDAYAKIRAGASAVQLYTALVFEGLNLVSRINHGLGRLLARDGFKSVADAVGTGIDEWL